MTIEYLAKMKSRACYSGEGKRSVKRQKLNMESSCKGILISPVNHRRMPAAVKEILNYLRTTHVFMKNDVDDKRTTTKQEHVDAHEDEHIEKTEQEAKQGEDKGENDKTKADKVEDDREDVEINADKQLEKEIKETNRDFEKFSPIRNMIKHFTFIKFHENMIDLTPSDVVNKLFTDVNEKKNNFRFRMICKIIPFDYVCKPHLSSFVRTIVPVLKKVFTEGKGAETDISASDLLKLLDWDEEEKEKEEEKKEEEKKEEEKKEEEKKEEEKKEEEKKEEEKKEEEKKEEETIKANIEKKEEKKKKGKPEGCTKYSWALIYKRTNTDRLRKNDVLKVIDNCIGENYVVDLKNPDFAIIVYINEILCGISIMKEYGKTRKLNIAAFNEDHK